MNVSLRYMMKFVTPYSHDLHLVSTKTTQISVYVAKTAKMQGNVCSIQRLNYKVLSPCLKCAGAYRSLGFISSRQKQKKKYIYLNNFLIR